MFTGIIEAKGRVHAFSRISNKIHKLVLWVPFARTMKLGASLAVNGVCLTVAKKKASFLEFYLLEETLKKTNLSHLNPKDLVNLERPLRFQSRLDGHFVLGHVDGLGKIKKVKEKGKEKTLEIEIPKSLHKFFFEKASVAMDGVSLTVGKVGPKSFSVHLIPATLRETISDRYKTGTLVNLEADVLAKLVLRSRTR